MTHSDIRPETIFLDTSQDEIVSKLGDTISDTNTLELQMHHLLNNDKIYIAPEVFANLSFGRTKFSYNHFKADAYSLGLVL